MNKKTYKIALPFIILAVGIGLWAFGTNLNAKVIHPKQGTEGEPAKEGESFVVKQVTISGLTKDDQGRLRKTYGDAEEAPEICDT